MSSEDVLIRLSVVFKKPLFEVKTVCKNHIWGTMVGKWVVNERNRDFPSFFKEQICTFANEEVFHKGYFGQSVLTLFFRGFVPFLSLADFVSRDKNLQIVDLQWLKLCFEKLEAATTSNPQNPLRLTLEHVGMFQK